MGNTSLEKKYKELFSNVWSDFTFYITKSELTIELADTLVDANITDIFNKVFIVDKLLGLIEYKKEFNHKVLSKKIVLEENMYSLLNLKRKLDVQEFDFLLEKYFRDAETCFLFSNWIQADLVVNTSNQINDNIKGVFRLQYSAYKEHLGKLMKHFYPDKSELPETNINILKTLEKHFPILLKKNKKTSNIPFPTIPKFKKVLSNSKKEKQLVTEKDAETFLLKSVFNLRNK